MKQLFFVLFLFPLFLLAQDCKLKKETDPFTHETKISTGFIPFNNGGLKLSISVDATPTEVDFFFWITGDQKCFDDASTAVFNYEGERLKGNFRNSGTMNCEGSFHVSFRNVATSPSALDRITNKKINSIKLTNGKIITDIIFTPEQKEQLMAMAACVVKESKSLIK
jgi:hypothetical protein